MHFVCCLFVCLFRQKNSLYEIVKGDEEDGNSNEKDDDIVFLTTQEFFVLFHNLFTDKISALFGGQRNSNLHSVLVKDDFTKRQHRLLLVLND